MLAFIPLSPALWAGSRWPPRSRRAGAGSGSRQGCSSQSSSSAPSLQDKHSRAGYFPKIAAVLRAGGWSRVPAGTQPLWARGDYTGGEVQLLLNWDGFVWLGSVSWSSMAKSRAWSDWGYLALVFWAADPGQVLWSLLHQDGSSRQSSVQTCTRCTGKAVQVNQVLSLKFLQSRKCSSQKAQPRALQQNSPHLMQWTISGFRNQEHINPMTRKGSCYIQVCTVQYKWEESKGEHWVSPGPTPHVRSTLRSRCWEQETSFRSVCRNGDVLGLEWGLPCYSWPF